MERPRRQVDRGRRRDYVLTALFNAVGEYSFSGAKLTGFVASFPDQWWGFSGYDPPSTSIAKEIGVDNSGDPIVVGESDRGAAVEHRAPIATA